MFRSYDLLLSKAVFPAVVFNVFYAVIPKRVELLTF
jgi:hypothetical protein